MFVSLARSAVQRLLPDMQIQVTRAFYLAGEQKNIGVILDVEKNLAMELVHNGKAQAYVEVDEPKVEKQPKKK